MVRQTFKDTEGGSMASTKETQHIQEPDRTMTSVSLAFFSSR